MLYFKPLKSKMQMGIFIANQVCKTIMGSLAVVLSFNEGSATESLRMSIGTTLIVAILSTIALNVLLAMFIVFASLVKWLRKNKGIKPANTLGRPDKQTDQVSKAIIDQNSELLDLNDLSTSKKAPQKIVLETVTTTKRSVIQEFESETSRKLTLSHRRTKIIKCLEYSKQ